MNEKTKYQLMKNRELLKGYQRSDAGEEATEQEQKMPDPAHVKEKTGEGGI